MFANCSGRGTVRFKAITCSNVNSGERKPSIKRRTLLTLPAGLLFFLSARQAAAFVPPPPGYRFHQDKLDGYSFFYPEDWSIVTTSGNDVFYRNPRNLEENLFVDISSPSSSKFSSIEELGTPEEAAERILGQYLDEFMSTRLGVKRTAEILSAASRKGSDGKLYYDIVLRAKSFASRNQLAVSAKEVREGVELEWDRVYQSVLGIAGGRLYQLRLQAATSAALGPENERLRKIAETFTCKEI